jgi:pyruvate kinase
VAGPALTVEVRADNPMIHAALVVGDADGVVVEPERAASLRDAAAAEDAIDYFERFRAAEMRRGENIPDAVAHAVCQMALELDVDAILCCTRSGQTARLISKYRPKAPIAVISPSEVTLSQCLALWGSVPVRIPMAENTDALIAASKAAAMEAGIVKDGSKVIIVAGVPVSKPGTTNMIKVDVI